MHNDNKTLKINEANTIAINSNKTINHNEDGKQTPDNTVKKNSSPNRFSAYCSFYCDTYLLLFT